MKGEITMIDRYLSEIQIRKRNLETKRQIQQAQNDKELELLMLWEKSLENIKEEKENVK